MKSQESDFWQKHGRYPQAHQDSASPPSLQDQFLKQVIFPMRQVYYSPPPQAYFGPPQYVPMVGGQLPAYPLPPGCMQCVLPPNAPPPPLPSSNAPPILSAVGSPYARTPFVLPYSQQVNSAYNLQNVASMNKEESIWGPRKHAEIEMSERTLIAAAAAERVQHESIIVAEEDNNVEEEEEENKPEQVIPSDEGESYGNNNEPLQNESVEGEEEEAEGDTTNSHDDEQNEEGASQQVEPRPPKNTAADKYKAQWMQRRLFTIMCRHGKECKLAKCRFAHSYSELRPRYVCTNFKVAPCNWYPNCVYGEQCAFSHGEIEERVNEECSRCSVLYDDKTPVAKICRVPKHLKPRCRCFEKELIIY